MLACFFLLDLVGCTFHCSKIVCIVGCMSVPLLEVLCMVYIISIGGCTLHVGCLDDV